MMNIIGENYQIIMLLKYNDQTELISEFLENIVHHILFLRKIYPQELFEKVTLSEFSFYYCHHSLLKNYLSDLIESIKEKIFKQEILKFILNIEKDGKIIESFIFKFLFKFSSSPNLEEIYMNFKPFFEKLNHIEKILGISNEDTTFSIQIHLRNSESFSEWKQIEKNEKVTTKNLIHQMVQENIGLEMEFNIEKIHHKSFFTIIQNN